MEYPFAIVDVFATSPLGGNPLAVVAGPPPDAVLPSIAREFNQSETLPVEVRPDGICMTQSAPEFGASPADLVAVASSLGLDAADLAMADLPAQVVSTGAPHLLVPVRSSAAVDRVRVDVPRLLGVLRSVGAEGCYVFALGSAPYARFFNPTVGLWEDPATGTAAGPLACYLVRYGHATRGSPMYVEQGHAMGRPSRIELRVTETAVTITGRGIVVAEGLLRI